MRYLPRCPLLEQVCTAEDLAAYNDTAQKCVQHWLNSILMVNSPNFDIKIENFPECLPTWMIYHHDANDHYFLKKYAVKEVCFLIVVSVWLPW